MIARPTPDNSLSTVVDVGEQKPLNYARPGTFRRNRAGRWRACAATTLWLLMLAGGTAATVQPRLFNRLSIPVIFVLMFAMPFMCTIALVGGWFLFPRGWRDTAAGLLLIVVAVLLPIVMWLRE